MVESYRYESNARELKREREENSQLKAERADAKFVRDFGPIASALRNARRSFRQSADALHVSYDRIQILKNAIKGKVTTEGILSESNQEVSRTMLEIFGFENFIRAASAQIIAKDEYGTLLSVRLKRELTTRETSNQRFARELGMLDRNRDPRDLADPREIRAVRVKNSTPEQDGSSKEYILRVPPWTETPREGLAWTFGFEKAEDYNPNVMT